MNETNKLTALADEQNATMQELKGEYADLWAGLSSFKDPKKAMETAEKEADIAVDAFHLDIERGAECYLKYAHEKESKSLGVVFGKLHSYILNKAGVGPLNPLTVEDMELLDTIATRVLGENHHQEASCMWRFILQLDPHYSRAWVGWAVSELEMKNTEAVEFIYQLGLTLLPRDAYLAAFAADFYAAEGKKEQATAVLDAIIETLHGEDPFVLEELRAQKAQL